MTDFAEESGLFPDYSFTEMKRQFGDPEPEAGRKPKRKPKLIDHVAEAWTNLDYADEALFGEGATESAHAMAAIAQVHATLALVEQQRIANEIAYTNELLAGMRHGPIDMGDLPAGAYETAWEDIGRIDATIREGLGLS